jgi:hypothetical protein
MSVAIPVVKEHGRSVVLRVLKAGNRVWLTQPHLDALFGHGFKPTPVWAGLMQEPLALERVGVGGSGRREVKARLCSLTQATARVALTAQALLALDIRHAGAFGAPSTVGVSVSGPRSVIMLEAAVCRAGPRLLLPDTVARKLGLAAGELVDVEVPSWPEPFENPVILEVPTGLREGLLVLDGPATERPLEPLDTLTVRLSLRTPA